MTTTPSTITQYPYVIAYSPSYSVNHGKWMIFPTLAELDEAWAKVEAATEAGELGSAAMASTSYDNPIAQEGSEAVICVFVPERDLFNQLSLVLSRLRDLGFSGRITYKPDNYTSARLYGADSITLVSEPSSLTYRDALPGELPHR